MGYIAAMLVVYLAILALLLAVGIAVGFALHWIIPAAGIGTAILIGVVAVGFSWPWFIATIRMAGRAHEIEESDRESAQESDLELDDDLPMIVLRPPARRRRKRK